MQRLRSSRAYNALFLLLICAIFILGFASSASADDRATGTYYYSDNQSTNTNTNTNAGAVQIDSYDAAVASSLRQANDQSYHSVPWTGATCAPVYYDNCNTGYGGEYYSDRGERYGGGGYYSRGYGGQSYGGSFYYDRGYYGKSYGGAFSYQRGGCYGGSALSLGFAFSR